jgi:anti-sigma B factor antagonist
MIIQMRSVGDIRILDLSGKITLGEGTMSLRKAVRNVLENGTKDVILNLREVNYIDSSGLGELMRTYSSVNENGGRLKLLHITKRIGELLEVAKLVSFFDSYNDEKAAIESCNASLEPSKSIGS